MDLVEELKMWGYHSDISEEGKKQHLEMSEKADALKQERDALVEMLTGVLDVHSYLGFLDDKTLNEAEDLLEKFESTRKEIERCEN